MNQTPITSHKRPCPPSTIPGDEPEQSAKRYCPDSAEEAYLAEQIAIGEQCIAQLQRQIAEMNEKESTKNSNLIHRVNPIEKSRRSPFSKTPSAIKTAPLPS